VRRARHQHAFAPVALYRWPGGMLAQMTTPPSTIVLRRCACGELSTITLAGAWDMADLAAPPLALAPVP